MRLAVLILLCGCGTQAAAPRFETATVSQGGTAGYEQYRIPGIVVTTAGTVRGHVQ
jgi:hypothetical protein